jgi:GNAT superfamily N-acetyltransferase
LDISLVVLNEREYSEFAEQQVIELADQHVGAGEWTTEEAVGHAREELSGLLTDRLREVGHVFMKGVDPENAQVGWVWIAPAPAFLGKDQESTRWLSQITVDEAQRGRGLGRNLLEAVHDWLEAHGVEELWLRVYNWNEVAWRLYTSVGYEVVRQFSTDAHLRKRLSSLREGSPLI